MKTQYLRFAPDEEIPALACIRKRKLVKYYTRETLAAVLAVSRLLDGQPAAEPFEFVLLETDALRRTETEIARTKNGTDGKIRFEPVYLKAVAGEESCATWSPASSPSSRA